MAEAHILEPAASGRAKCRGCNQPIAKGELRFGERLPNPFADGVMTVWFHLPCAALKRPESFTELREEPAAKAYAGEVAQGLDYPRLPRINGVQRAPSARAKCRHCRETIARDDWRIVLTIFEEGVFGSAGFLHVACSEGYFGTGRISERLWHFAPELTDEDRSEITKLLTN